MTNMMKKKITMATTKTMTLMITNMMKFMKKSYQIFYNKQINFRYHIKLKKNNIFFSRKRKIILNETY